MRQILSFKMISTAALLALDNWLRQHSEHAEQREHAGSIRFK